MSYSQFSDNIMKLRYSHIKPDGEKETWDEIAERVAFGVLSSVPVSDEYKNLIANAIKTRKFIPGGRFLAQVGRKYHQTSNCFLLRAVDTREGWGDLMEKASIMLMSGGGIGIDYSDIRPNGSPLKSSGGTSSGPIPLMNVINEIGRGVMSGGKRRSAIWAGLRWSHADIFDFISVKNWPDYILKQKKLDWETPAKMDMTNISVILDKDFFDAFDNPNNPDHELARKVYYTAVEHMVKTGEPGFSVDYYNKRESLRNAPVHPDTYVYTDNGYMRVGDIIGEEINIWTGKRFAKTVFKLTRNNDPVIKLTLTGDRTITTSLDHEFFLDNGAKKQAQELEIGDSLLISLPDTDYIKPDLRNYRVEYALGYMYGDGSFHKKYPRADVTFCTDASKECSKYFPDWSVNSNDNRGYIRIYSPNMEILRNRDKAVFPHDVYSMEKSAQLAFIAGLFDADGNYFAPQHRIRLASIHKEFLHGVRRLLEQFGILSSVNKGGISTYGQKEGYLLCINGEYVNKFIDLVPTIRVKGEKYIAYRPTKIKVVKIEDAGYSDVYCCDVGVSEHSFMAEGIIISNCCEVVSEDDSDACVLGSINLAKIVDLDELAKITDLAILFLLAGTEYTDRPVAKVKEVQQKNRRLGLGLMGLHEWLIKRGKQYGPDDELATWLDTWKNASDVFAEKWANKFNWNIPIATRAIAPNGTISIAGGQTTSGIEPIFAVAYKRKYYTPDGQKLQYVIDAVAEELIENGADPDKIEDAYTLSYDIERRIAFQAFVQKYVDNAISSTINLAAYGTPANNDYMAFANILYPYLPLLRGITVYPDGARSGQPLEVVSYHTAIAKKNHVFDANEESCKDGICGL